MPKTRSSNPSNAETDRMLCTMITNELGGLKTVVDNRKAVYHRLNDLVRSNDEAKERFGTVIHSPNKRRNRVRNLLDSFYWGGKSPKAWGPTLTYVDRLASFGLEDPSITGLEVCRKRTKRGNNEQTLPTPVRPTSPETTHTKTIQPETPQRRSPIRSRSSPSRTSPGVPRRSPPPPAPVETRSTSAHANRHGNQVGLQDYQSGLSTVPESTFRRVIADLASLGSTDPEILVNLTLEAARDEERMRMEAMNDLITEKERAAIQAEDIAVKGVRASHAPLRQAYAAQREYSRQRCDDNCATLTRVMEKVQGRDNSAEDLKPPALAKHQNEDHNEDITKTDDAADRETSRVARDHKGGVENIVCEDSPNRKVQRSSWFSW